MKVSIIIPAYNAANTIVQAIMSVYQQSAFINNYSEFEVIVVNDGSKDDTYNVISDLKDRESLDNLFLYDKKNSGVSSTRNYGIRKARGEWIALLDADDVWIKDKIEKQFHLIELNNEIDFIGCARNNEVLSILGRKIESLYRASVMDLLITTFPQTSTAIIKKSLFDRVGLYNESMTHAEDGELWVRICNSGGFYYHPDSLVITGGGKNSFGESGLSADLGKMFDGNNTILGYCYNNNIINRVQFCLLKIFYKLKHYRRVLIVKMRK
ncbi:glycosyltransferase family 2 protein [Vibrio vulnificus]|uniref:glycosyltransferase family 2 protein n=1 Tax=Vibrio vulnificus TaxID=672 RepID=UPI0037C44E70